MESVIAPATADVGRLAFIQEEHPQDLETLRGRLGLHPRSAGDFFDALLALKLLEGSRWAVLQHCQHGLF